MEGIEYEVSKEYFTSLGVEHISIDLSGNHRSLVIDLSNTILRSDLLHKFNVVTNMGTSEHVLNQYECFKNIHNLCKLRGLMIHAVPVNYFWREHGLFQYPMQFFEGLANYCHYRIYRKEIKRWGNKKDRDFVCCALVKSEERDFVDTETFSNLPIKVIWKNIAEIVEKTGISGIP